MGRYRKIGPVVSNRNGMLIVALRKNEALVQRFDKALSEMEEDGQLLAIFKTYWKSIKPFAKGEGVLIPHGNQIKFKIPAIPN